PSLSSPPTAPMKGNGSMSATTSLTKTNARRYDTAEGVRLNVPAIAAEFGGSMQRFRYGRWNGWPALGGGKLAAVPSAYDVRGVRREEATYLRSEVARVLAPTFDGFFSDTPGGPRMKAERAGVEIGGGTSPVSRETFRQWEKECPHLDYQPLLPSWEPSPTNG